MSESSSSMISRLGNGNVRLVGSYRMFVGIVSFLAMILLGILGWMSQNIIGQVTELSRNQVQTAVSFASLGAQVQVLSQTLALQAQSATAQTAALLSLDERLSRLEGHTK